MNDGLPFLKAPEILAYGISGLAFLLAGLTYLIIKNEQERSGAARKNVLRLAAVFMGFCLVLAGLSLVLPLLKSDELRQQLEAAKVLEQACQSERGRMDLQIGKMTEDHAKTREELVALQTSLTGIAELAQFNDADDPTKTLRSLRNAFATIQVLTGNMSGAEKQIHALENISADRDRLREQLAQLNTALAGSAAATEIITRGQGSTLDEKIKLIVGYVEEKARLDEQNKDLFRQLEDLGKSLEATKKSAEQLRLEVSLFDPFRPMVTRLKDECVGKPEALYTVAQEAMLRYDRFPLVEKEHEGCHLVREQAEAAAARVRELEGQNAVYRDALELCKKEKPAVPQVCSLCKGTRQIVSTCARCEGAGETTTACAECDGEGDVECSTCSGYGGGSCRACNGSGRLWCLRGPCPGCGWSGVLTDSACGGTGVLTCGSCKGKGRKDCTKCVDGEKSTRCSACKGSGSVTTKCVRCAT